MCHLTSLPSHRLLGLVQSRRFHRQRQAHQEVVMPLRRVHVEVHRLVGTVLPARLFHLTHELLVFFGTVPFINLEPSRVDRRQQVESQLALALLRELERRYPQAQGFS